MHDLSYKLESSTAKSLYQIFGLRDDILQFDKHHCLYKRFRYENSKQICNNLQSQLSLEVKQTYLRLKSEIYEWENSFFAMNSTEATADDLDDEMKNKFFIFSNTKKLMRHWSIK